MSVSKVRPLGDVADFLSGFAWKAKQFSDEPNGMPIIRIQNVGVDASTEFKYWPDTYADRFVISKGDLLLTLSGSFRTAVWSGPNALLNQRIVKVTPRDDTNTRWLFYALEEAMARIANMGRHALVSNVALSDLKELGINVPPLEEQKRIAGILDQADSLRRLRTRALNKLGTLGQAIFHEMFGDVHGNKKGFERVKLGEVIKVSSGQGLTAKNMKLGEFPVYGGNGVNGYHDEGPVAADTIVVGRVGAYCGAVHTTTSQCWVTDNALIVRNLVPVNTAYLAAALEVAELNQYAGRAAQPLVSGSRIYPVEILFPPIEVQNEFEHSLAKSQDHQKLLRKSAAGVENLFASLQHRAFRGEL